MEWVKQVRLGLPGVNQVFPFRRVVLRSGATRAKSLKFFLLPEVKHGVAEQPICFGLVTATIGFEPCDDIGIQAHGDGLLHWPMEFPDFGGTLINHGGRIGKISTTPTPVE
jgi:hypothetical protein